MRRASIKCKGDPDTRIAFTSNKRIKEVPMDNIVKRTAKAKVPAILILASFIIVVAGMKAASSLLVPFFLAVFIAVICAPPLFWLQRKGVPKVIALILILVGILVVGLLFGALIGPSLNNFLSSLPGYQERLSTHIGTLIGWLRGKGINIPAEEVSGAFHPGWVMNLAGGIFSALSSVLTNGLSDPVYGGVHPSGGSGFSKEIRGCVKKPGKVAVYH